MDNEMKPERLAEIKEMFENDKINHKPSCSICLELLNYVAFLEDAYKEARRQATHWGEVYETVCNNTQQPETKVTVLPPE